MISPIGSVDSETRSLADDFLELLIEPTLARFDFNVIRADKLATPTAITSDIVRLVQEAALCIIDLTGHNANVFYECGRRHETGKPFIQMIAKSWESRLPFDVAGIRTLTYDLTSPRAVLESQKTLATFVEGIAAGEVSQSSVGTSISTVASAIERLERKFDALLASNMRGAGHVEGTRRNTLDLMLMPPRRAFMTCLRGGDLDGALAQLDRLKSAVPYDEYVHAMGLLASTGFPPGLAVAHNEIDAMVDRAAGSDDTPLASAFETAVHGVRNHHVNTGTEKAGIEWLTRLRNNLSSRPYGKVVQAFLHNQIGILAWSCDDYDLCAEETQRAVDLEPGESSYVYNLALAREKLSQAGELEAALDRLQAYPTLEDVHVRYLRRHDRSYGGEVEPDREEEDEEE